MITLRDILKLNPFVTLLDLDVREADGRLIENVVIGKDYRPTSHQLGWKHFNYIDADINKHGRAGRNGMTEIAYDIDWKAIPKKYLDMEVDTLNWIHDRYGNAHGSELRANVVPIQMDMTQTDCGWK